MVLITDKLFFDERNTQYWCKTPDNKIHECESWDEYVRLQREKERERFESALVGD